MKRHSRRQVLAPCNRDNASSLEDSLSQQPQQTCHSRKQQLGSNTDTRLAGLTRNTESLGPRNIQRAKLCSDTRSRSGDGGPWAPGVLGSCAVQLTGMGGKRAVHPTAANTTRSSRKVNFNLFHSPEVLSFQCVYE